MSKLNNPWIVESNTERNCQYLLFCFHFAGGNAAAFRTWSKYLANTADVLSLQLPGRLTRFNEPLVNDMNILIEGAFNAIVQNIDRPFFFFGHSMGAVLAFEIACRINPQPQILFVSACGAPHVSNPNAPIHNLPDSEFIKSLQELNGLPAEVSKNEELMELLLPTLRADFEAIENYKYISHEHRLDCPIIAFGGENDFHVDRARLDAWEYHTNGSFKSKIFPGDHFFINTARRSVIDSMLTEMRSYHAKN